VSEPAETPLDPALIARRAAIANRIERRLRWMLPLSLFYAPIMVAIGVSDLANRWLNVPRRIDALFILIGAIALLSPLRLRRTVRRLQTIKTWRPATKTQIMLAIASMLGSVALVFVFGYLLGGWLIAALLAGAMIVTSAALMLRAQARIRRRRQAA
jgi:uncharacterized membrane protein YedE/YeeE